MKKVYIVLAECGEGVIFTDRKDAEYTLTGEVETGSSYASLGDAFRELYGDDNLSMQVLEL